MSKRGRPFTDGKGPVVPVLFRLTASDLGRAETAAKGLGVSVGTLAKRALLTMLGTNVDRKGD